MAGLDGGRTADPGRNLGLRRKTSAYGARIARQRLSLGVLVRPGNHNGAVRACQPALNGEGCAYSVLSAYSGAGGLDLGFEEARFQLLWAIDSDRDAVQTYRDNLGEHVVHGTLPDDAPPRDLAPDVVIGGPPCQGFSVMGRMNPEDPRSAHVFHFLDLVERVAPRAFCMENVKALAVSPRWELIRHALLRRARELEYTVELIVLNAADYGVPQARERMFLIGSTVGTPLSPVPTTKGSPQTVRQTLARLPPFGELGNDTRCVARVVPATTPVMRPSAHQGSLLFNGSGRVLELDAPARTLPASMGGNATPIIDQAELERRAKPWVVGYHARLRAGKPPLIRAPARMRRLTVEEAAALQTFPPGWSFAGSQVSRFRQIGNAVPPILAQAVASSLRSTLELADGRQTTSHPASDESDRRGPRRLRRPSLTT